MSIGFCDAGRLLNGVQFQPAEHWSVVDPPNSWATQETVEAIEAAITRVNDEYADTCALRINHSGRENGGWLRPHKSHQSGRDVDLAFYYRAGAELKRNKGRETIMDLPRNWALIKALVTLTDVQMILVDRRIQKVLFDYALARGEDRAWLDSLFHAGKQSILQHARRHRDHFHVRLYNPRAQELGRRVQPLLAKSKDETNVAIHKVRRGDTIGALARKYGSTVALIRQFNGMKNNNLSVGRSLGVPTRGPCTSCPLPPELVVPPRRLPPVPKVASL